MFHEKKVSKEEEIRLLKAVIENLLPDWKEGDLVEYKGETCVFYAFSHDHVGNVYGSVKRLHADPTDFFSTVLAPFKEIKQL